MDKHILHIWYVYLSIPLHQKQREVVQIRFYILPKHTAIHYIGFKN